MAAQLVSLSCAGKQSPQRGSGERPTDGRPALTGEAAPGLTMRVTEGRQGAPAVDHTKLAPATPIPDGEAEEILKRLSPIATAAEDKQAFALRERSQPPPRTGKTIKGNFPPPNPQAGTPPAEAGKDLTVLRYAPEGDVPI